MLYLQREVCTDLSRLTIVFVYACVCLYVYPGPVDEDGQPHGFCTVTYSSSDRFEGHFAHGEKNGKGKFFFFDGR